MSDQGEEDDYKDKEAQTRLHVYPNLSVSEESPALVTCGRACQTAVSSFPDIENHVFYNLLEFIPYKEITQDAVRELELPRKARLQFKLPEDSDDDSEAPVPIHRPSECPIVPRGGLKKRKLTEDDPCGLASALHKPPTKEKKENYAQTALTVLPHILNEDAVASVYVEVPVQTSISLIPRESPARVVTALRTGSISRSNKTINCSDSVPEQLLEEVFIASTPVSETDLIDATAEALVRSDSVEDHVKELLKFTAGYISTEFSKMADLYKPSNNPCQCTQKCTPIDKSHSEVSTEQRDTTSEAVQTGSINLHSSEHVTNKPVSTSSERKLDGTGATPKVIKNSIVQEFHERRITTNVEFGETSRGPHKLTEIVEDETRRRSITQELTFISPVPDPDKPKSRTLVPGNCERRNEAPRTTRSPPVEPTNEVLGDYKQKKKVLDIPCECHPTGAGAAPNISPLHTPVVSYTKITEMETSEKIEIPCCSQTQENGSCAPITTTSSTSNRFPPKQMESKEKIPSNEIDKLKLNVKFKTDAAVNTEGKLSIKFTSSAPHTTFERNRKPFNTTSSPAVDNRSLKLKLLPDGTDTKIQTEGIGIQTAVKTGEDPQTSRQPSGIPTIKITSGEQNIVLKFYESSASRSTTSTKRTISSTDRIREIYVTTPTSTVKISCNQNSADGNRTSSIVSVTIPSSSKHKVN